MSNEITHKLLERDVARVTFKSAYDEESETVTFVDADIGDSIGSYDSEITCTCGEEFESYEDGVQHVKEHERPDSFTPDSQQDFTDFSEN